MEEKSKQGETNCHSDGTIKIVNGHSKKITTRNLNYKLQNLNPVFENGECDVKTVEEEIEKEKRKSSKKDEDKLASSVRLELLMGHGRFQQFQIWVFAALVCKFNIYSIAT